MSELKKIGYKQVQIIGLVFFTLIIDVVIMKYLANHFQVDFNDVFGFVFFLAQVVLINFSIAFVILVWLKNKQAALVFVINALICTITFSLFFGTPIN